MAKHQLHDEVLGEFSVIKRRGMKRMKLTISHDGGIRVTMPLWLSLKHAKDFAKSHRSWLQKKRPQGFVLADNGVVGRSHRLRVYYSQVNSGIRTKLKDNEAALYLPIGAQLTDTDVVAKGQKLLQRALKKETEERIIPRLELLAKSTDTTYNTVRVRQLRSRWGSCSSNNDITLSLFLAQLSDELVDYVLIHELIHTKVHAHNQSFWEFVSMQDLQYKQHRKQLKDYRPTITLMA